MAKLTSEEFNNKYREKIVDNDDLLVELMEDFADSIPVSEETETLRAELEQAQTDLEAAKRKYKERFFTIVEKSDEENKKEVDEEPTDKIIDIKEV